MLAIAANASISVAAGLGDLPDLRNTVLYKKLAHNCRTVDLATWNHPTKQVLRKHQVHLRALELCNSDKYPIFHVDFKYDPMGRTGSFFQPFYKDMFIANGRHPMAFVETTSGNAIVMISNKGGKPEASFDLYRP